MRIIELENRCTGNRTVGSNPTLSAKKPSLSEDCARHAVAIDLGARTLR